MLPDQSTSYLLDSARAAKEVGTAVALALIATYGNPEDAIEILAEMSERVPPESREELDAAGIGAQAIRDAVTVRETGELPDAS